MSNMRQADGKAHITLNFTNNAEFYEVSACLQNQDMAA